MLVYTIFLVLLVIIAILLVAVILIQSGEGGISSSIGGASQLNSVFGAQTPSIMIKITTTMAIIFGVLTIGLNAYSAFRTSQEDGSELIRHIEQRGVRSLDLYRGETAPTSADEVLSGAQDAQIPTGADAAAEIEALMRMQEVVPQQEQMPAPAPVVGQEPAQGVGLPVESAPPAGQ